MSQPDEIPRVSGPGPANYLAAVNHAIDAFEAERAGRYEQATTLAAIGQVHATLAAASAAALHEEYADIQAWRTATGQEGR